MEKKSEYLSEIWGYHSHQQGDYVCFTGITVVFLSRFFAIVRSTDCNCKLEVVIFIYILWHAVNKLSIFCNVRTLYLIKRRLNEYFFPSFSTST
jgi:hypothetical protein